MMQRGVRAVGERGTREPPKERGYRRLGAAVIDLCRDLETPTRAGAASVQAGAIRGAFLTVSNANLKFWCHVADVDMNHHDARSRAQPGGSDGIEPSGGHYGPHVARTNLIRFREPRRAEPNGRDIVRDAGPSSMPTACYGTRRVCLMSRVCERCGNLLDRRASDAGQI